MLEMIFVFFVVGNIFVGVTEEIVVPATNKAIEVATPVVEKVIDSVMTETPKE